MIRINVEDKKGFFKSVQKFVFRMDKEYLSPLVREHGLKYAQQIMPYRTGELYRALRIEEFSNKKIDLVQNMPRQRRKDPRPYHLWIAGLDKYPHVKNYIYSGEPDYMEKAKRNITLNSDKRFTEVFSESFK
jgi:hypothetical protein